MGAALELLVRGGYRALSMEAVRLGAGDDRARLYRRWRNKHALVAAAIDRLSTDVQVPADTGGFRGDFEALIAELTRTSYVPRNAALMPRLMADAVGDDELHEIFYARLVEPRREVMRVLVRRAQARGEVRPDVDPELAVDLLAGPLVYRIVISGGRLERIERDPMAVLDAVLAGIAPARPLS